MPRRKQNTPKRLKSDDESEGEEGNGVKDSKSEPHSDVEDSMDEDHSQSEAESDGGEDMDEQSETSVKEEPSVNKVNNTGPQVKGDKIDSSEEEEIVQDKKINSLDVNSIDEEKVPGSVMCQKEEIFTDVPDKKSDIIKDENTEKVIDNIPEKEIEKSSESNIKKEEVHELKVQNVNSLQSRKEETHNGTKPVKELSRNYDINTLTDKHLHKTKVHPSDNHKDKIKDKVKVSESSSKPKLNVDAESPISKLLNMVNNPEKIQTKHSYSNSFSLAASSSKMLPGISAKSSVIPPPTPPTTSNNSTTSSSHLRSSKPLSGFLPPYNNVYSQLQNMYSKMHHLAANNHSKEEKKTSTSSSSSAPSPGPKTRENKSSPTPSPVASDHQEQPLDLSVKSKGLDLSVKVKNDLEIKNESHSKHSEKKKYIPSSTSSSEGVTASEFSSLKSLEEKFGGNPFKMDKNQRVPKPFMPYMHPMLPMYGGALYTPALFSTHPWMHTEKIPRSEISPRKNSPSTPSSPSKTSNHSSSDVRSPSKLSPTLVSKITDKDSFYNKKYTNLKCSCKKEFETLYQLTLHLKQTGHTPSSRVSGQQEFPKLVRGQDMWLNHGSEQTKQILRCIQCGESFKTLPDLTVHMMKTKHYANIVGADSNRKIPSNRQVNDLAEMDIYKCFQCEESFSGMEDFSKHMLSSGHHKNPIVIQPMSPGLVSPGSERSTPREDDSREPSPKRLRTLSEASSGGIPSMVKLNDKFKHDRENFSDKDENSWDSFPGEDNKIRCETCGDKIEMSKFVEHVRQCIRNSSWDYSTPLKKRRVDSDDRGRSLASSVKSDTHRPSSVSSNEDRMYNGRHTPSSPKSVDSSKNALVQPSDNSNDGSALRAMESFIEQSFTPSKKDKSNFFGFGPMSRSVFPMPFVNGHSPKSPSRNSAPPVNTSSNLYNKYLPPLYLPPADVPTGLTENNKHSDVKSEKSVCSPIEKPGDKRDLHKIEIPNENNNMEIIKSHESHSEKISNHIDTRESRESITPSPKSLREKYLNVPERDTSTPSSSKPVENNQSNASALESLQGLVYGKSFESEHPLDSLQKLIHNTEGQPREIPNGAYDAVMCNRPLLKEAFPSSALLKSSMIPGYPSGGSGLSRPQSPSKSESSVSPAPGSHTSDRHTPELSSENEGGKPPSEEGGEAEKSDSQGDYVCQACSRSFATIGTYRFHTSRCHLSKAKKYHYSKENLNKTPYVYLPLDHSAKFNKYYEMANELANKTK